VFLSAEEGINMSKINARDLTTSNESYLVDIEDSSTLESISGGSAISDYNSVLANITKALNDRVRNG
jgi:prephenate dehydratase